jgi:hypothetical protein
MRWFGSVRHERFASTRTDVLAGADAAPAVAVELQVIRPLPNYGTMGGYRYRRFAAVAVTS